MEAKLKHNYLAKSNQYKPQYFDVLCALG